MGTDQFFNRGQITRRLHLARLRRIDEPPDGLQLQFRREPHGLHDFIEDHAQIMFIAAIADHLRNCALPVCRETAALEQLHQGPHSARGIFSPDGRK